MERVKPVSFDRETKDYHAVNQKSPKPWRWQVLAWTGPGKPRVFSRNLEYWLEWPGGESGGIVVLGRFDEPDEPDEGFEGELYKRELLLFGIIEKARNIVRPCLSSLSSDYRVAGWTLNSTGHTAVPDGDSSTYYHLPADWPYFIEAVTGGWTYSQHLGMMAKLAFPSGSPFFEHVMDLVKNTSDQKTAFALATSLCPYARMNEMVRRLGAIADILDEQLDRRQALGGVLLDLFGGSNAERQTAERALDRLLEIAYQAGVVLRPWHLASSGFKSK